MIFLALSGRESSLVHTFCEQLDFTYASVHMTWKICDSRLSYLGQKLSNFTTNALKAYLCAQACTLNAFVISKIHMVAQKPRGRQLNAKVCGSESAIFLLLSLFKPLVKRR